MTGVFDTLRTFQGRAVDLARHVERLEASARHFKLPLPPITPLIEQALRPGDHKVRTTVAFDGTTTVTVEPLPSPPRAIAIEIVDDPVPSWAGHKTLAYLEHVQSHRRTDGVEPVRLHRDGHVAEGLTSNVFVVIGGRVATPHRDGVLPGIVRARVLDLVPVTECDLTLAELHAADEVFVTSSLRGVVPVTRIGNAERAAGPATAKIVAAYEAWMRALI